MPRWYELRDLIGDPTSPTAYFQNFDDNVQNSPHHVLQMYLRWEGEFETLDSDAWEFLKGESRPYLVRKDASRGWQQLFDFLNQARAYNYFKRIGCSSVRFIPRQHTAGLRTPDLEAVLGSESVLGEVKTLNISQKEVRARTESTVRSTTIKLEGSFFRKLRAAMDDAEDQMRTYDRTNTAQHYGYIIPRFDDFLAEYKEEYFRQIDEYLSDSPTPKIKLVFHNDHTPFYKPLTMTNATVVNEGEET